MCIAEFELKSELMCALLSLEAGAFHLPTGSSHVNTPKHHNSPKTSLMGVTMGVIMSLIVAPFRGDPS